MLRLAIASKRRVLHVINVVQRHRTLPVPGVKTAQARVSSKEVTVAPVSPPPFQAALSRWDNEGGAGLRGPQKAQISAEAQSGVPELTNAESVQLRVRVIALENLVISLLAEAPDRQLDLAAKWRLLSYQDRALPFTL